jgi:hypothetical protein
MAPAVAIILQSFVTDSAVCSPRLRSVTRGAQTAKPPVNTGVLRKMGNAGGGTRTPDTRIMIPRVAA